ncbi:hypothetical protein NQ317_011578 [Molorchus minor]|uniref:Uncharacterized protein n=1 Tax=Molorchus minor TaxID=1323400 RepID=A0ABQ9JET2_9CUCU|nr:hypothetical protein NQ317_011578 [Molorchus minor]
MSEWTFAHISWKLFLRKCFHRSQEISIRIISNGWLHKGTIICPPCKEICAKEFAEKNEVCKLGDESPPSTAYPRDELPCGSLLAKISGLLFLCYGFDTVFYLNVIFMFTP